MRDRIRYIYEDIVDFVREHKVLTVGLIIGFIVFILVLKWVVGVFLAAGDSYEDVKREHGQALTNDPSLKKNMSVLLLGLDKKEAGDSQRADSIMIVTYDAYGHKSKTLRIPRDLYVKTDNYEGKINGLYDKEGVDGMMQVVSDYVGVPLTHYVKTDFDGLENIVDKIGGIDLNSDIEINKSNNKQVGSDIEVGKGQVHLNGREALAYSRIRYIDNDIKRGQRQQQVIKAIAQKLTSTESIPNLDSNLQAMSPYVKTNIKISDVAKRLSSIHGMPDMSQEDFEWDSFEKDGSDFVMIKDGEREKISKDLRQSLGLNSTKLKSLQLKP